MISDGEMKSIRDNAAKVIEAIFGRLSKSKLKDAFEWTLVYSQYGFFTTFKVDMEIFQLFIKELEIISQQKYPQRDFTLVLNYLQLFQYEYGFSGRYREKSALLWNMGAQWHGDDDDIPSHLKFKTDEYYMFITKLTGLDRKLVQKVEYFFEEYRKTIDTDYDDV
jgi:hypothetical protein